MPRSFRPHIRAGDVSVPVVPALLILVLSLGFAGCRHVRAHRESVAPALAGAGLRGQRLLVLPGEPESTALARDVARHLSTLPVRICSVQEHGENPGADMDLAAWRDWAWERRIPYLLVTGRARVGEEAALVRLLPSCSGDEVRAWTVESGSARAIPVELRVSIRRDLGVPEERPDGHPTTWTTARPDELDALRTALLVEPGDRTLARVRQARETHPLDPALVELEGLARWRAGETTEGTKLLRRAQSFNPEGASQLPVLAREAGRAGQAEFERALWQLATDIWPGRLDYTTAYAEILEAVDRPDDAAGLLLAASARGGGVDVAAAEERSNRPVLWAHAGLVADVRYLLGWMLYLGGDLEDALGSYGDARRIYEELGESESVAACRNNMGVSLVEMGRAAAAIPHLRAALLARTDRAPTPEEANTLYNLGAAYEAVDRLYDADEAWRKAAERYGAIGAPDDQFDTLLDVVLNQGEIGARDGVEEAWTRAVAHAAAHGDEAGSLRARALDAVGVARARVDLFDESLDALQQALEIWVAAGDRLHEGQTRYNMAIPFLGRGDHEQALSTLAEARAIAVELNDTESVVTIDAQMEQIEQMK